MRARLITVAVALAGLGSGVTATTSWGESAYVSDRVLHIDAAAGEANSLSVNVTTGETDVTVSDMVGIAAGNGCTALEHTPQFVRCPVDGIDRIEVSLGDEADRFLTALLPVPVTVFGGPGDDLLYGTEGQDTLDGGTGDDVLFADFSGSAGPDVYRGGDGTDTMSYERHVPQTISLDGVANDGVPGEGDNLHSDVEKVFGGAAADTIVGSDGDDDLNGGQGADVLEGRGGQDTLDGYFACEADRLLGGDGGDTLLLTGYTEADGGPGDDTFRPEHSACGKGDVVVGGPGRDTADYSQYGFSGDLVLSLDGRPNDGYASASNLGSGIEVLKGSQNGSVLIGGPAAEELIGGASDDVLVGGGGTDVLTGGGGFDVADYSDHATPVSLTLNGLADDGSLGESENLGDDIEDLRGGDGDDTLTGDSTGNYLDGGPGADLLQGGGGIDVADYFGHEAPVTVDLDGAKGDDGATGEGDTVSADVEGIIGGLGADRLTGNSGAGLLAGAEGDDVLLGLGGQDALSGDSGADTIRAIDHATDEIACGDDDDSVTADPGDEIAEDCEAVVTGDVIDVPPVQRADKPTESAPAGGSTPAPAPQLPGGGPTAERDTLAPAATIAAPARVRLRSLLRSATRITVGCSEPCSASLRLMAKGRRTPVARASGTALARDHVLKLRPSRSGRTLLARVRSSRLRLRLVLTVRDEAGNTRQLSRALRVRR